METPKLSSKHHFFVGGVTVVHIFIKIASLLSGVTRNSTAELAAKFSFPLLFLTVIEVSVLLMLNNNINVLEKYFLYLSINTLLI